ncbi:Transmembrane protein 184B [Auxenochlorella protothecoides]|uniref:Transmembrane protein 184B n=1 Tax=Auxenochlorella protothecoides TaxID=3075 RepID=A0A087SG47_AUXPR|nr:Transmembrane protein 184B [Auxenochlorella protothecoides]KFM24701.1 Transmembrane protein 184B [Auxenochlorella protothecoides]
MLLDTQWAHILAGCFALSAILISLGQIIQHLRHYSEPVFQRYIVRIIFLVPVYAMASWPSLIAPGSAVYLAAARDCYEALVIYNFMSLCLAYVGGPGAVETKMAGYMLRPSWWTWTCCLPPLPVNGRFVRWTKQGALQFVIIKPILAVLVVALYATGNYKEGSWAADQGYVYITVIYNLTYSIALYALLLFYLGTHELLVPFRPLLKFILIKSVIFLSFWQAGYGFFIAICSAAGLVKSAEEGVNIQNFLLCMEMLPAAICMLFAFPYAPYVVAGGGLSGGNVTHAISIRDMVTDTVHQFAPAYHNYVLYSDGSSAPGAKAKTVRARTFVAVGHESSAVKDPSLLPDVEMGRHDFDSPPRLGKSKFLSQEKENPFALDSDEEGGAEPAAAPAWDTIRLESPRRRK